MLVVACWLVLTLTHLLRVWAETCLACSCFMRARLPVLRPPRACFQTSLLLCVAMVCCVFSADAEHPRRSSLICNPQLCTKKTKKAMLVISLQKKPAALASMNPALSHSSRLIVACLTWLWQSTGRSCHGNVLMMEISMISIGRVKFQCQLFWAFTPTYVPPGMNYTRRQQKHYVGAQIQLLWKVKCVQGLLNTQWSRNVELPTIICINQIQRLIFYYYNMQKMT